jgi:hypothetical protein
MRNLPGLWICDENKVGDMFVKPSVNRLSTRLRVKFFASDLLWFAKYKLQSWNERLNINWFVVFGGILCVCSAAIVVFGLFCAIGEITSGFKR